MANAKKKPAVSEPKKAVCKELNCFDAPTIKGYCRLHFIRALAGKQEVEAKAPGDRRRGNRMLGLAPNQQDDAEAQGPVQNLGELDTEIEGLEDLESFIKKAG